MGSCARTLPPDFLSQYHYGQYAFIVLLSLLTLLVSPQASKRPCCPNLSFSSFCGGQEFFYTISVMFSSLALSCPLILLGPVLLVFSIVPLPYPDMVINLFRVPHLSSFFSYVLSFFFSFLSQLFLPVDVLTPHLLVLHLMVILVLAIPYIVYLLIIILVLSLFILPCFSRLCARRWKIC